MEKFFPFAVDLTVSVTTMRGQLQEIRVLTWKSNSLISLNLELCWMKIGGWWGHQPRREWPDLCQSLPFDSAQGPALAY